MQTHNSKDFKNMNINPISTFTCTNNLRNNNSFKNHENKTVTFGFSEDYGPDPCLNSNYEGGDSNCGFWGGLKGAFLVLTFPISFPIILIRQKISDDRENEYFKEITNPNNNDKTNCK